MKRVDSGLFIASMTFIIVNESLTFKYHLKRDICQSDPLSPIFVYYSYRGTNSNAFHGARIRNEEL